jgi:hypothetical protein
MSEWIKCSERMPNPGEPVDLWVGGNKGCRLANYRLVKNYGGKAGNDFFEPVESGISCVRNFSHWQPLPAPPEL